jgi:maltooligosyltrehalose synthase
MLGAAGRLPLGEAWKDTAIALPPGIAVLENVLTGERCDAGGGALPLARACGRFPVAALLAS